MALSDTFVKNVKPSDKPAGDKHTDGGGLYLLVHCPRIPRDPVERVEPRYATKWIERMDPHAQAIPDI